MAPSTAQGRNNHILLFAQFTQKIKLANGPNAAFQQPWVAGHSVLQQSTEAVQP